MGQSVYDLREDEQLALAMQQSLAEEADPDAHSSEAAVLTPDTGGAPEMVQPVQQTAMLSGATGASSRYEAAGGSRDANEVRGVVCQV